uniref:Nuclear cap-binding protein subunit 3 n=1 Tax=Sander lucioperca TaxID=283035 RepID=A0A8C9YYN4_SANLU
VLLDFIFQDTSRRYENKAGAFITGIDVNSRYEAIERKEKRARRFHIRPEENVEHRNVFLDKDTMKKAISSLRLEAVYVTEYPPAHIEWIDDTSCEWDASTQMAGRLGQCSEDEDDDDEEEEEGEVDDDEAVKKSGEEIEAKDSDGEVAPKAKTQDVEDLSQVERESLLRNDLRPAIKPFKGNKLLLRFATHDDKKELGAARRSRYYMKYGNPNYGGMKGILSNSWKRRFHNRRIQRDVIKSKNGPGDLPEEPIKEEEEEEEEEEEDGDEYMEEDDRVVEYKERAEKERSERGGGVRPLGPGLRGRAERSPSRWSESDEMDYDLELKMISTPSPKKTKKMTMYADELDTQLKSIRSEFCTLRSHMFMRRLLCLRGVVSRNRVGGSGSQSRAKSTSPCKVTDVRQLLEEKKRHSQHRQPPPVATSGKTDVRQRLGKRRYSPDRRRSPSPVSPRDLPPAREPIRDVHRRLGVATQEHRADYSNSSKDRKSGLWSRLGSVEDDSGAGRSERRPSSRPAGLFPSSSSSSSSAGRKDASEGAGRKEDEEVEEEDDSTLQKMWGAMIKQKQERVSTRIKKSRLDHLPSLQIEISRDSSEDSDA